MNCMVMIENLIYKVKVLRTKFVSDEGYLKKRFIRKLGYIPDFKQPKAFNEKVTARMIYDRNDLYGKLANKLVVRELVIEKIGEKYLVPLIGVYKNYNEIDINKLPTQFVLKCTHDSGSATICRDKSKFNFEKAKDKLTKHMNMNMYVMKREWHYKNIPAFILAEKFIDLYQDPIHKFTITTCRVHCFQGQPKYLEIDVTSKDGLDYSNIYDTSWQLQPFTVDLKENTPIALDAPPQLMEMISLAKIMSLSAGYSRIDFLLSQQDVFFSEITLTPNAGRMVIEPKEWDVKLGELWQ